MYLDKSQEVKIIDRDNVNVDDFHFKELKLEKSLTYALAAKVKQNV